MIHKIIITNILLTIALLYTGIHLCEQETAFLNGHRALDRDTYDWTSLFFAKMTLGFALYACFVAMQVAIRKSFTGVVLGLLAVGAIIYSLMMMSNIELVTMRAILPTIGIYMVGTICLSVYAFLYIPIQKRVKT